MVSNRFDDLSRALASGMPRRTALKLFAVSVAATVLSPWRGETAEACILPCNGHCQPGYVCTMVNYGSFQCLPAPCPQGDVPVRMNGVLVCVPLECLPR